MTREDIFNLQEQLEVLESELQDLEFAQRNPAYKKVFNYITAETFFVQGGFSLEAIASFMSRKVTPEAIVVWHDEFLWDQKRKAYLDKGIPVADEAKDLVMMTLAIARTDPSSTNITSYKRAIEALVALEKKANNVEEEEEDAGYDISPEKLDEVAKKAGLR